MKKNLLLLLKIIFIQNIIIAQIGGNNIYEFINLPASPRITAMGGNLITVQDGDVNLAFHNPASLNRSQHQSLSFNNAFYLAKTNHGYASYGHYFDKKDLSFHGGIQYIQYGTFDARDEFANDIGSFKASEYAITGGVARQLNEKLSAGANMKIITSQLAGFQSTGLSLDLATMYIDTAKNFTATFLIKNAGMQLNTYAGEREPIPFEIQAGFSKRLKYLPLRLSVIGVHLQKWNITYDDPNQIDEPLLFGEAPKEQSKASLFIDNLFRHFVFNGEFLFGKRENFKLRFGYNHLRRAELSLDNIRSLAGISIGTGFKIKQFGIDYGLAFYQVGTAVHHLGISTSFESFKK